MRRYTIEYNKKKRIIRNVELINIDDKEYVDHQISYKLLSNMKRYTIEYNKEKRIIKNVELINIDDKEYVDNQAYYKLLRDIKNKDKVKTIDQDNRNCVNLSFLIENIIRRWVNSSKKRVLCWEEAMCDRRGEIYDWKKQYTEMDFVKELGENDIIIGEIKTQIMNSHKYKSNISKQFEIRRNILLCMPELNFQFYGVTALVDKTEGFVKNNGVYSKTTIHQLNESFLDNDKIIYEDDMGVNISRIKLSAEDVFNYGIKENIIYNDRLLKEVYELIEKEKIKNMEKKDTVF